MSMQILFANELVDAVALRRVNNAPVTLTLTAANSLVVPVEGHDTVVFAITGTFAGYNGTFELSFDGGTTWVPASAVASNATNRTTAVTVTGVIGSAIAYFMDARGATHARLRGTALGSGAPAGRGIATIS